MSTDAKAKTTGRGKERRAFPARVKCEAVLSVWAERRRPLEVCRELGIPWQQLNVWQRSAMEAMMAALEPRTPRQQDRRPALGARLEDLLEKTERRANRPERLHKRLESIQKQQAAAKTKDAAGN